MGWIGSNSELLNCLRVFGAEKDEEGRFIIVGDQPKCFMGSDDNDVVLSDNVKCIIKGKEVVVSELLKDTSHGFSVTVF